MKTNLDLNSLNFDNLVKKSEKRKSLYKYSDEIKSSSDFKTEMKNFRKKVRNDSLKVSLAVFNAFKEKKNEEKAVKEFNEFYKNNFVSNDYSFESFSQISVKENAEQHKLYSVVLTLVKEFEVKEVKEVKTKS